MSDVYQDLFHEGSYVGKGIYDVDAFEAALANRVPENRLLSHDLFEGSYARAGLCTDIHLVDDYPAHYLTAAARLHRWVRGDWQIARWLWRTVPDGTDRAVPPLPYRTLDDPDNPGAVYLAALLDARRGGRSRARPGSDRARPARLRSLLYPGGPVAQRSVPGVPFREHLGPKLTASDQSAPVVPGRVILRSERRVVDAITARSCGFASRGDRCSSG